ncbi:MAG: hypothetical protein HYW45_00235 [Candidatus Daviesbacteria bacterium]|nr:MAG: hypothetical protein HYW45_00235 [Candidatus Daviesbacteria bacterium]
MNQIKDWRKYLVAGLALLLILAILKIWANNTTASLGEKLVQINKLQQEINWENLRLENNLASISSLSYIASAAANLGFSKAKAVQYLSE